MLGNKKYCSPLTVTDHASRYLICCEGLESTREAQAITVFEQIFKEYGLPGALRSDNGVPFACPNALYGLSSLSWGGYVYGLALSASNQAIPSKMVGMNACI